jgi:hypothetical protein
MRFLGRPSTLSCEEQLLLAYKHYAERYQRYTALSTMVEWGYIVSMCALSLTLINWLARHPPMILREVVIFTFLGYILGCLGGLCILPLDGSLTLPPDKIPPILRGKDTHWFMIEAEECYWGVIFRNPLTAPFYDIACLFKTALTFGSKRRSSDSLEAS